MRLIIIAITISTLVGCGRMNPMNPSYQWTGEGWMGGSDTGDSADIGLSGEDTGL